MIKILIADDHPIMRKGLKHVLADESGMCVVGEVTNAYEIPDFCKEHEVNVLLLDIFMPGPGLLETITRLTAGFPDLKILILSMHSEVELILRAIKAGAMGYVNKNKTVDHLARAIRGVYKRGCLLVLHACQPDDEGIARRSLRQLAVIIKT